jgi:hypothetical protein
MKKIIIALAILMTVTNTTVSFAHEGHGKKHHAATKYTCTMHPEVIMDKPGKCPKCGMKLVPMKTDKTTKTTKAKKPMNGMKM